MRTPDQSIAAHESEVQRRRSLAAGNQLAAAAAVMAGLMGLVIIWVVDDSAGLSGMIPALAALNMVVVAAIALMIYIRRQQDGPRAAHRDGRTGPAPARRRPGEPRRIRLVA